jgi:hypothetical protein
MFSKRVNFYGFALGCRQIIDDLNQPAPQAPHSVKIINQTS